MVTMSQLNYLFNTKFFSVDNLPKYANMLGDDISGMIYQEMVDYFRNKLTKEDISEVYNEMLKDISTEDWVAVLKKHLEGVTRK